MSSLSLYICKKVLVQVELPGLPMVGYPICPVPTVSNFFFMDNYFREAFKPVSNSCSLVDAFVRPQKALRLAIFVDHCCSASLCVHWCLV
jgi:hypothetical protein